MHSLFQAYVAHAETMSNITVDESNPEPNNDELSSETNGEGVSAGLSVSTATGSSNDARELRSTTHVAILPHAHFKTLDLKVSNALDVMRHNASLWAIMRKRLEGEIQGALPPPGSPPGLSLSKSRYVYLLFQFHYCDVCCAVCCAVLCCTVC